MPLRKEISEILNLMEKIENIRCIAFAGHIDHGKTTLTDSLLSEAGLLSPELAGEARALDYLEEEQKRGITMKSANISLYYEKSLEVHEPFLINLVDTPGHLDFSGKVTRALRLVDGVVVVVDAVEEIISQSETVILQAIQEGVKPVLFINKIDRLIRELKLSDEAIKKKYIRIIKDFNKLIERYAEPPYNEEWKVSPASGTVAFGSALHKWGFTVKIMEKSDIKFSDIKQRYDKETYTKETYKDLSIYLPIHKAILEMVVDHLPNPKEAQKYRIKKIYNGELNNDIGNALLTCDKKGPLIICVSKVQADKGHIVATGRIFSGLCSKKQEIFLLKDNNYEKIQRIAIFMGQRREQVDSIPAGNIVAIEGLKNIKSGETIIEPNIIGRTVPFGNVKYITTPVVTVSLEPEYLRDLDRMKQLVEDLLIEDPNLTFEINEENGEYLLSGMGPLHLEVTLNEIKKRGVDVSMSEPRAIFKESCKHNSSIIKAKSMNNETLIELKIERLDDKTLNYFRTLDYKTFITNESLKNNLKNNTNLSNEEIENFWLCDKDQNIIINLGINKLNDFYRELILEIINKIHLNGPLCGEKLTGIKFIINNIKIDNLKEENTNSELSILLYDGIKRGLIEAKSILLEPIYKTFIQVPPNYVKNVVSLLTKYSAKIKEINQENDYQAIIEILLPVRHSIKFAEEIRSSTSGRAFWQNEFHAFVEVPPHEANNIISDIRFLKGLTWE